MRTAEAPRPEQAAVPDAADASHAAMAERIRQLETINAALIDRIERASDLQGGAFSMFETAISLEAMVRDRTAMLESALATLASVNLELGEAHAAADAARLRLRDAIESLSDGFTLYDADDRLVMYNRAYLGFWPALADKNIEALRFAEVAALAANSGHAVGSLVSTDRWLAARMAHHAETEGVHVQALADGRWIQINELSTSEGGRVGIYTDITEVKAEDARERARELAEKSTILQATLDTIRLGVAVYDADRRLTAWNGSLLATIGLPEDALGMVMTHADMVASCERVNGPFGPDRPLDWLDGGASETVALRRHTSGRIIEVRRAPMPQGGMVMAFEDVTDRLQAAEALERRVADRTAELLAEVAERRAIEQALTEAKTVAEHANRSKTSFLAAASHDLLQPLNAARLFVSALTERRLALPTRALVRQTRVALDSVEDLLEALFEISRLDAGAIVPVIAPIELESMLSALRIEFAPLARVEGLELDIPESPLWVLSDMRLLRRILQNFLSNAIRYTREGRVALTAEPEASGVRITVRDSGPGIAEADVEAIFEEFRRLETGPRRGGNGLGLAIVRRASAMLGHPVSLQSKPGVGSAFSMVVPLASAQDRPRTVPTGRTARGGPAASGNLLVIDNDTAILEGMAALLHNWGYRVFTAPGPEDPAVGAALAAGINAIIADFHLETGPDGPALGDAAIADVRQRAGREVPAFVITADRSDAIKARLAAAGLPMLTKPVKPAQLRALLRTAETGER